MISRTLVLSAFALLACGGEKESTGSLDVRWTGNDTGRLNVPAEARWCPADTMLEIVGVEGDSGVAVALFPADSLEPGTYPARPPRQELARPRSGVALRRFGENLILGYYSLSGVVTLDSGAALSGSVEATLKGVNSGDQITLFGTFRNLVPRPADPACRAGTTGNPADTGVR